MSIFSRTLERRIKFLKAGVSFFKVPLLIFVVFADSLKGLYLLRKIRLSFNQCNKHCFDQECLKNEDIKLVRDNYINICEKIAKISVMNFFVGWFVRRTLIGWDDLVEDITMASDAEFRSLIVQIAGKVS